MDKYINSLIDDLDEFLKCSSVDFENEVREYNTNSENHAYFASERMLSNLSNHYLSSLLMEKHNFNIKLALSEFPINILNSSSKLNVVSSETAEVDLKNIKWNRCYVDGYFKIETDEENYHIFLEYKMQNIFDYTREKKKYETVANQRCLRNKINGPNYGGYSGACGRRRDGLPFCLW